MVLQNPVYAGEQGGGIPHALAVQDSHPLQLNPFGYSISLGSGDPGYVHSMAIAISPVTAKRVVPDEGPGDPYSPKLRVASAYSGVDYVSRNPHTGEVVRVVAGQGWVLLVDAIEAPGISVTVHHLGLVDGKDLILFDEVHRRVLPERGQLLVGEFR